MAQHIIFKTLHALDVKPGHITVDGIVLDASTEGGTTTITHRHAVYMQDPESTVQVFARVPPDIVEAIRVAMVQQI